MPFEQHQSLPPLDLRRTKCPLNFVKARLALEKLPVGTLLEIWVAADSDSALNVPNSLQQEGHTVLEQVQETDFIKLLVQRRPD